jgi:hypothetical protein
MIPSEEFEFYDLAAIKGFKASNQLHHIFEKGVQKGLFFFVYFTVCGLNITDEETVGRKIKCIPKSVADSESPLFSLEDSDLPKVCKRCLSMLNE